MVDARIPVLEGTLAGESVITRDLSALDGGSFDVAIAGGGIHGVALALEASRRGLRVGLVEAGDFGAGSSGNSLRILHGGLRYLQVLDLKRFYESVAARKWYAREFPGLVKPLPCLMPLYEQGAKRRSIMRAALQLNDVLSLTRNEFLEKEVCIPAGRILDRAETREFFPSVRLEGLAGAALWYDYQMASSERILMEMLREACTRGAVAANYVQAVQCIVEKGQAKGLVCRDRATGAELRVKAPIVVNCAGAASALLPGLAGCTDSRFAPPSVAFNVLFKGPVMGACAMAVAAPTRGAAIHFICPSTHGLWAGTAHVPRRRAEYSNAPAEAEVTEFVAALHHAVPEFSWSDCTIRKIYWGTLPVRREMTVNLTSRPDIVSHEQTVRGLHSVVGIKFTTAVQVAVETLRRIFGARLPSTNEMPAGRLQSSLTGVLIDGDAACRLARAELIRTIETVAREEAVLSADDLLLRRTNWMFTAKDPEFLRTVAEEALQRVRPVPSLESTLYHGIGVER